MEDAQPRERSTVDRAHGAEKQRDAALVRMADVDRLIEAQVAQLDDISGQRRDARAHGDDLAEGAAAERERRDAYSRAQEDRWLQEVDAAIRTVTASCT